MLFTLAWRNIWRNKRRSLITIMAVSFAVTFSLFMRSMQIGFYARMIDNVVSFYTGYLQIQAPGYQEKQSLDESFIPRDSLLLELSATRRVTVTAPRLESFALVSAGDMTDGTVVIGIDPNAENALTGLRKQVITGRYLEVDDRGILLAEGLANYLKVNVGDEVVLLSTGYHGISAAGKCEVVGIVRFPSPDLNARMAYLALPYAQWFYGAEGRLTSVAVMIEDQRFLEPVVAELEQLLGQQYDVVTWETMMPEMVQYIEFDNVSGIIIMILLYVIVGMGVLGTMLMMTMERTREFGMLVAVGMKKGLLRGILIVESALLSLNGALLGAAMAVPFLIYFRIHPIMLSGSYAEIMHEYGLEPILPFSMQPSIFIEQTSIVFLIALAASFYPLFRVSRLQAVEAMRGEV